MSNNKDFQLALWLCNSIALNVETHQRTPLMLKLKVSEVIRRNKRNVMNIAKEALGILGEPTTQTELLLGINLAIYASAGGRPKLIEYARKYLPNQPCHWPYHTVASETRHVVYYAAKACEGEYLFDEALYYFTEVSNKYPDNQAYALGVSDVLVKMNRLDDAIAYLKGLKKTPAYKAKYIVDQYGYKEKSHYKSVIDKELEKIVQKKESGYIYRPRGNRKPTK